MLKKERQAFILHNVNLHNKILVGDISEGMRVSEDTIRRDLQELSEEGMLIKVHGGALSNSFRNSFNTNSVYDLNSKQTIATKTAKLIKDGMFIITSGGTTIIELAKALPKELHATFITGSVPATFEYIKHPNIEIISIGGKISKSSQITVGGEAISKIKEIRADMCILGINALDITHGLTDNDWEIVEVKKAMMESSERTIVVTISEKLNTAQRIRICETKDIDTLVTELSPEDFKLKEYLDLGINIL
jgi:DeoR/GlpR family transcriptional regulator of sugar metabolism